jgi:hypothetical protein
MLAANVHRRVGTVRSAAGVFAALAALLGCELAGPSPPPVRRVVYPKFEACEIEFRNRMSNDFFLLSVAVGIEGVEAPLYRRQDDSGLLDGEKNICVYNGPLPAGRQKVLLGLNYRGNDYGPLAHAYGYRFELKSSHDLHVAEGKAPSLVITAYEKGGPGTPLEQRPTVRWDEPAATTDGGSLDASEAEGGSVGL